ncbi:unnamed protein product [Paramecium primaurelia]|uniref:Uncharacterized protein n=1 Tax=Paramecium primaurelia TaxID=5886 RepID=A0A8S1PQP3_PARPR|nr:unnamed protein product [Paramecium primaurelia]
MNNEFDYIEAYHAELEYYQIICLYPLIKEYYKVHYDLTCAIANIINQNSDMCIFKIYKETNKKIQQQQQQNQQKQQQQQEINDKDDDTKWFLYPKGETKQEQPINKFNVLQSNMYNFKEQLFIQFSICDINLKNQYLYQCRKIIDFIETIQKDVMMNNLDTQYLEEDIQRFCENDLQQ